MENSRCNSIWPSGGVGGKRPSSTFVGLGRIDRAWRSSTTQVFRTLQYFVQPNWISKQCGGDGGEK